MADRNFDIPKNACLYQELGLESLHDRRWYRKLLLFFKICKGEAPQYLKDLLPPLVSQRDVQSQIFRPIKSNSIYFANSFLPYCVSEWNKLNSEIRQINSISQFKKILLSFIRP